MRKHSNSRLIGTGETVQGISCQNRWSSGILAKMPSKYIQHYVLYVFYWLDLDEASVTIDAEVRMVFSTDFNNNLFADLIDDTVKAGDLFK